MTFDKFLFIGRLGEVTLNDFKLAVDRHGNFRYHFKSLDPEFGTVKEEVRKYSNNNENLTFKCSPK